MTASQPAILQVSMPPPPTSFDHILDHRTAVAIHEAGHAVIGIRHRLAIRYVTLASRVPDAEAHVHFRDNAFIPTTWIDMALYAAGPIAEDIASDCHDRRCTAEGGGSDFERIRDSARYTRTALRAGARPDRDRGLSPRSTVRQIAAAAWADTYRQVVDDYGAILAVADALLRSRRALTGRHLRRVIDGAGPVPLPPRARMAEEFWPPRFTGRNFWTPIATDVQHQSAAAPRSGNR